MWEASFPFRLWKTLWNQIAVYGNSCFAIRRVAREIGKCKQTKSNWHIVSVSSNYRWYLDLSDAINKGKIIEYPKAWLTRVANNKIKDIYTQAKKDSERLISIDSQDFENTYSGVVYDEPFAVDDDQIPILKEKVINMLDENERQLLFDRYSSNKSISQIAKEHNTTENNIYQKIFRLKTKNKMLIDKVLNE